MNKKVALLFAGQAAQKAGMFKDIAENFVTAREIFDKADELLGFKLSRLCFEGPDEDLTKTENAQPAIYSCSWVAFRLLLELVPDFVFEATAGLSLGEFAALAAAGAFSFEDGLRLIRTRGLLMAESCVRHTGSMAAIIGLEEAQVTRVCEEAGVQIANLNCPGQIVISGLTDRVSKACELAKQSGARRCLVLPVAGAFHSSLMSDVKPGLRDALCKIEIKVPAVKVISNVTAQPHTQKEDMIKLLVEQVSSPVLWEKSMKYLIDNGYDLFVELGPGQALAGFMKRISSNVQVLNIYDCRSLEETVNYFLKS